MKPEAPRILLVRLSAIGDCLHAVPVLVALRRHFPKAYLGWAVEKAPHALLNGHPLVDRFHVFPRHAFKRKEGTFFSRVKALQTFRKELRAESYDTAIDLQGLTKSGLVAWWSRARQRIGFRGPESRELNRLFANRRVRVPETAIHIVEKNLELVRPLGVAPPVRPEWVMPDYAAEARALEPFLREHGLGEGGAPYAVVNPGATWATKRWPPEHFGAVAKGLTRGGRLAALVTWADAEERAAAETIARVAGHPRVLLAPPTNLRELAALLAGARLFVGNDTGPLHLAVALGVKSVAVFGASDPLRNGPYGREHRIQAGGPECQPCWKTTCQRQDLACLMWVKPEKVLESCEELLGQAGGAAAC
ncbi:MAG: lipopolysaccharide heptosyltransferase I [Planctomycetota bacterium]|nr:lipopolysaccharide heptosyltransferase I [Planctomycetota bacterium]